MVVLVLDWSNAHAVSTIMVNIVLVSFSLTLYTCLYKSIKQYSVGGRGFHPLLGTFVVSLLIDFSLTMASMQDLVITLL